MDEICYFNLVDIVKNELNYGDLGEIWFRRHGLSLFAGRKQLQSDQDIPLLMETKDINGYIIVYAILGGHDVSTKKTNTKVKKNNEVGGPNKYSLNEGTTNPTLKKHIPFNNPWRPKLPFQRTTNPFTAAEVRGQERIEGGEESSGDESDNESDPDVVLSEGDLDDEDDDDLFTENVDEEISSIVHRGLKGLGGDSLAVNENEGQDDIEHEYLVDNDADLVSSEDELHSEHDSDDEVINYPVFNPNTDFQRPIELSLGLKFPSVYIFRKALRYHAVENGYDYYLLHNGSERVSVYCRHRCKCPWVKGRGKLGACTCGEKKKCSYKVHAKKCSEEETFQIRSLRLPHNCGWIDHNSKCTSLYLAERYLDYWRLESETKVDTFQKKLLKELGIEVGYYKAYYAKEKALKMIYGEADEQYKRVWDYAETVKKHNEGSSVFVQLGNVEKPPPVFKRMYMCLDACKKGFLAGCRPIIGVDGCHLKGPYPGQLLTAVSKDVNCNIYPLAWAIVEVENRDSWTWFLDLLVKDIEPTLGNITFMSDRQKGLVEAFATVVPNAEIRYCCRHIWSNFKLNWAGEAYKQIFWKAARAYTKEEFEEHMKEIKKMSVGAHAYLSVIPTKHWCRHAFNTRCKSSMMLNNCCESFNNTLKKCRDKPVLSIMEWIRRYCMRRMFMKWEGADKVEGNLMPAALKQLNRAAKESRNCQLLQSDL
ncbi:hypothetical protein KSS87_021471 [Heliosperma pusillum]|nr:hypothetical protein KSS87_021471 [Heliosperma pusillum]